MITQIYFADSQPPVNFGSNFRATTPVYPLTVDIASEEPGEVGVLPPENADSQSSVVVNFASNFKATTPVYPTSVELSNFDLNSIGLTAPRENNGGQSNVNVNFESYFKATTPVYPTSVEASSPNPIDVGLLPPQLNGATKISVNFESNFKATTPVYPLSVDQTSPNPNKVGLIAPGEKSEPKLNFETSFKATSEEIGLSGLLPPQRIDETKNHNSYPVFESNFKATTPVYPKYVEATSPNSDDTGLLPPLQIHSNQNPANIPSGLLDFLPPKFDENYNLNRDHNIPTTISTPSKFYQAPKLDPDLTIPEVESNDQLGNKMNTFMKSLSGSQWHDIREQFKIPDYEFPLEENGRPSYEGKLNSFDAKPVKKK